MSPGLPILDIRGFLADPTGVSGSGFVDELRAACHEPGFCYIKGHGIDPALEASVMSRSREFFALPREERTALAIANSPHFRGYTILGDERTKGVSDWRDQLDLGPEEESQDPGPDDPAWLRLRGPNQWPPSLPQLAPTVLAWMDKMEALGVAATRALAIGLGQPVDRFDYALSPQVDGHVKIIRYPARALPQTLARVSGFITIRGS